MNANNAINNNISNDLNNNKVHKPGFIAAKQLPIPTLEILKADGTLHAGAAPPALEQALARKIYQTMIYIRVLDERMVAAQRQGRLSFYLTCTGEEAAVIGAAAACEPADMIMGQYREQGALRFRGFTTEQFMNQMLSNEKDLGKGRQMPIHYGTRALNYMTISSPLATQIPQAAGYAYGQKLDGEQACTLCYFGEGAASEGDFHAGLNMAAVLKAPVIFVCRNNGYAISTPTEEQFAGDGIASRGVGYGMQSIRVDGNDLLAVYAATVEARKIVIETNEPVLIETMSYRLGAHSTSDDPSGYRSREEEDKWREQDPIERMKNWLIKQQWWSEEEDTRSLEAYRKEVLDTLKRQEKLSPPALEELITDVYDQVPAHLQAQYDSLGEHLRKYPDHYPASRGA
ncbi:thiamine pyrophosphate-dependent dehydrogenase E1 component subunit alpha [Exilibacterium tricleocarpae]|uniref:2-oxoisovalerate dehydrogenase subunit alpha n=1 Tax=Exilibacterium tricleocarpae TaxID=2591008 RepID=A0A545U5G7_9GAMM|nr:thiamine pyrophosphate-dependent dehydrogenase E1 component subunit alpha [Exilibacterium tricleocarpae]TQV84714.1 thiamine pyrophosphate-dependent dehydrogenase E1 component subunit alpha [Exilibacterium tricleocarpae]